MPKIMILVRLLLASLVALLIAGATWLWLWHAQSGDPGSPRATDFRDAAQTSGLGFRMAFLPSEQGEFFKINLYDHGCGVVVGDFDGDGFDDIYFLNQNGRQRPVSQQGRRHVRGRHLQGRGWPRRSRLRGRHLRGLRQLRPAIPLHHQHPRRQCPVPQHGRWYLQGRHQGSRPDPHRSFADRYLL